MDIVKEAVRRVGVFFFALLLAFLTSVVHISHTCHENLVGEDPGRPEQDEPWLRAATRGEGSGEPCLACLFLKAMRSTLLLGMVLIAISSPFLETLESFRDFLRLPQCTLPHLQIRAPPAFPASSMMPAETR